jgi:hypothetical protein
MIRFEHSGVRLCDGYTRREWLNLGTLGALGLSLPQFLASKAAASESANGPALKAQAKACIQIFLWGGPGAQETWDLKVDAPDGTRGEFQPIATSVPGIEICEHLPLMAQRAHNYSIVRSLTHDGVNHGTSSYHMLTGHIHWAPGTLRHPTKIDMPNLGANAARFLAKPDYLPAHVQLPAIINDGDGLPVPGQDAGILGENHTPFRVLGDLTRKDFKVPALALAEGVSRARLLGRVGLQEAVETQAAHLASEPLGREVKSAYNRAVNLLASPAAEAAFDLAQEPERVRARYGNHNFAQALLLARRLVEAGVPFVTVYWNSPSNLDDQSWDTHNNQHVRMREHLLPYFDKGMSALLDDLVERGMLDDTLVTWYGEFGRTPKINKAVGRDHWGFCQSIGLAGGGIQRGLAYGTSTKDGGYVETCPVRPDDLAATIFRQLGIDSKRHMFDLQNRPIPLSYGEAVPALLA